MLFSDLKEYFREIQPEKGYTQKMFFFLGTGLVWEKNVR